MTVSSFDLIDEAWVPVLEGGVETDVSLRAALTRARELDGLAAAPPTMTLAILRYLVAAVLHAIGPPRSEREWAALWSDGQLPPVLDEYLDRQRARFDLFSDDTPFAQAPGIEALRGETKPTSVLIMSEPVGNAVPLFGARTEADPPVLTPPEAARWLLHTLGWDTAGIKPGLVGDPSANKGKSYGNPVGPLGMLGGAYPIGQNLFETLLLNLPILADGLSPGDVPIWARDEPPDATWSARPAEGVLDLLTWPSRRIRLIPEVSDRRVVVRQVVLGGGDRLVATSHDLEPHTLWRWDNGGQGREPGHRPRRFAAGKAAWQGLDALVAIGASDGEDVQTSMLLRQVGALRARGVLDRAYPLSVGICSCEYGNQSAVVENVIADVLPLPVASLTENAELRELLIDMADSTQKLVGALNKLDGDLRRAAGGDLLPLGRGQRPGTLLVHRLDLHVRRILAGLQRDPDKVDGARQVWGTLARTASWSLADELLAGVPPEARSGREVKVDSRQRRFNAALAEKNYRISRNKALARFTDVAEQEVG